MSSTCLRFGLFIVLLLINNNICANVANDTIKVYEDDKIFILDYGKGEIDLKYKNTTNAKEAKLNYQIRLFYDNPIFLGTLKKNAVYKNGLENTMKNFIKQAIQYQNENFFNDLDIEPSQIKIISSNENDNVNFYYLRAYNIKECVEGKARFFWCDEDEKERRYVEININGKEVYFKDF